MSAASGAMRIAIVSDIHGNLPALEAVAADIRRRGADQVAAQARARGRLDWAHALLTGYMP